MSGGSFGYAYSRASDFVDSLDQCIAENTAPDEHGDVRNYPPHVIAALKAISAQVSQSAKLMKAAEWLCSGDSSPETFMEAYAEIMSGSK